MNDSTPASDDRPAAGGRRPWTVGATSRTFWEPVPSAEPCPLCGATWVEHQIDGRTGTVSTVCSKCRVRLDKRPDPLGSWAQSEDHLIALLGGDDRSAIRNWVLRFGDRVDVDVNAPGAVLVTDWWGAPASRIALRYPLDLHDFWLQLDKISRRACDGGGSQELPPPEVRAAPWFHGPMVAGGYGWSLADLAGRTTRRYPTRFRVLDDYLGGIHPGEIWSISGEAGTGVTALTVGLAIGLADAADVLLANSHVPTLDLVEMIRRVPVSHGRDRLRVTSWQAAWYGPVDPASGRDALDQSLHLDVGRGGVVILDTWDEQVPPLNDRATVLAALRKLRELAEQEGIAVILTSRTPRHLAAGAISLLDDVFDDVSTVRFRIVREATPRRMAELVVRRRGRGGPVTLDFDPWSPGARVYTTEGG